MNTQRYLAHSLRSKLGKGSHKMKKPLLQSNATHYAANDFLHTEACAENANAPLRGGSFPVLRARSSEVFAMGAVVGISGDGPRQTTHSTQHDSRVMQTAGSPKDNAWESSARPSATHGAAYDAHIRARLSHCTRYEVSNSEVVVRRAPVRSSMR